MTDKPAESAVERYGHWCDFCQTHHSSVSCFHPSNPARYVHPETGHGSATGVNEPGVMTAYVEDWRERAMQAEAKLAALEAEVEALKCCGNCTHHEMDHDPYGECTEECDDPYTYKDDVEYAAEWPAGFGNVRASDNCHLTPSRWQEREA